MILHIKSPLPISPFQKNTVLMTSKAYDRAICKTSTFPSSFSHAISVTVNAVSAQFRITCCCAAIASEENDGSRIFRHLTSSMEAVPLRTPWWGFVVICEGFAQVDEVPYIVCIASVPWIEMILGPRRTSGPTISGRSKFGSTVFVV